MHKSLSRCMHGVVYCVHGAQTIRSSDPPKRAESYFCQRILEIVMRNAKRRGRGRRPTVARGQRGRGRILGYLIRLLTNELRRYHESPRSIGEEAPDGNVYMEIDLAAHRPAIDFDLCVHTARGHIRLTPQQD